MHFFNYQTFISKISYITFTQLFLFSTSTVYGNTNWTNVDRKERIS